MPHLLTLRDWSRSDLAELFAIAEGYEAGGRATHDGAVAMFFPRSSLRTRFSFECGAAEMGLQPIVFPPEALDTGEDLVDIASYLGQWARLAIVRHPDISVLERLADADALPVINAMTGVNHPCEVLSDLFALAQTGDVFGLRYLFVGPDGNIARAWWEAGQAFGLEIQQCCPPGLRVDGMLWADDFPAAIASADVVLTDGPGPFAVELAQYMITASMLDSAPPGVRFAPCPPFVRGREVSADAVAHPAFVGYGFKRFLKPVQQAVMAWALDG